MSQPEHKSRQKGRTRPVGDDMAYEAYKTLLAALGAPASRKTTLSPEELTALYVEKLAAADLGALHERFTADAELAGPGVTRADLGQIAYEAYLGHVGGRSVSGQPLPGWHKLSPHLKAAWITSAHAVHIEMVHEIRRRIDDLELRESPEFLQGLEDWRWGRVENADVCRPASGYHSSPHRRCVLRGTEKSTDLTPPGEWQ